MGRKKKSKFLKKYNWILLIIAIILLIGIMWEPQNPKQTLANIKNFIKECYLEYIGEDKQTVLASSVETIDLFNENELTVLYIDVGQADCELIECQNQVMLIDAGNNEDGKLLVDFIKGLGIEKIDYLIGTHVHEDHIGGLDDIIKNFEIGTFYMNGTKSTTMTYKDIEKAAKEKKLSIKNSSVGEKFYIGECCNEIIYNNNKAEDENNTSIVVRSTYGNNSFIFMGDLEKSEENKAKWPKTTVLKVGHHGSPGSSSEKFLEQINPTYSVISVGENDYGHPSEETLSRLENINSNIYRTDELGTIIIKSDGNDITVSNLKTKTNKK